MGKSSGGGDTTTTVNPPDWAVPYITGAAKEGQRIYGQGPQQYYPNQTYAGFDPLQLAGQQANANYAQSVVPGLNQNIFGSFNQALNSADVLNNPAITAGLDTIESRANQNYLESILPQLRQQATGTGNQFSSKAQQSEYQSARDLQQVISDAQANLLTGTIGDAMRQQNAALAVAPNILGTGLMGGDILQSVGSQQQAMNNLGIQEAINRWNFGQQAPTNALNTYIGQLGGLTGNYNVQQSSQDTGSSALGGAIGGGLLGASAGNALSAGTWLGAGPAAALGPAGWAGLAAGALLGAYG